MIDVNLYKNRCEFKGIVSFNNASIECNVSGVRVYEIELQDNTRYYGDLYLNIRETIRQIPGKNLMVVYLKDILLTNRLLWECDNVCGCLYVDSKNPYQPERMVGSRDRILWNIQAGFSKQSDKAFMSGWKNSYDNKMFSKNEIEEYVENTRIKLAPYLDKNVSVLEIGCGSGMISDVLAPLVREYSGCDISDAILEKLKLLNKDNNVTNMDLYNIAADEIVKIGKTFDVILSSSVTEYFSGVNYLRYVIDRCIECIDYQKGGIVFFGDVFDLDLKEQYMESVKQFHLEHPNTKASNSFAFELFVSPRFWYDIALTEERIESVIVTRKKGVVYNEINRFRYDVTLKINKKIDRKMVETDPYLFKYQFAGIS